MKKPIKSKIEVEISDIEVDERYYTFKYKVKLDGKVHDEGEYNNDYENGMTPKEWEQFLRDGHAVATALVQVFE